MSAHGIVCVCTDCQADTGSFLRVTWHTMSDFSQLLFHIKPEPKGDDDDRSEYGGNMLLARPGSMSINDDDAGFAFSPMMPLSSPPPSQHHEVVPAAATAAATAVATTSAATATTISSCTPKAIDATAVTSAASAVSHPPPLQPDDAAILQPANPLPSLSVDPMADHDTLHAEYVMRFAKVRYDRTIDDSLRANVLFQALSPWLIQMMDVMLPQLQQDLTPDQQQQLFQVIHGLRNHVELFSYPQLPSRSMAPAATAPTSTLVAAPATVNLQPGSRKRKALAQAQQDKEARAPEATTATTTAATAHTPISIKDYIVMVFQAYNCQLGEQPILSVFDAYTTTNMQYMKIFHVMSHGNIILLYVALALLKTGWNRRRQMIETLPKMAHVWLSVEHEELDTFLDADNTLKRKPDTNIAVQFWEHIDDVFDSVQELVNLSSRLHQAAIDKNSKTIEKELVHWFKVHVTPDAQTAEILKSNPFKMCAYIICMHLYDHASNASSVWLDSLPVDREGLKDEYMQFYQSYSRYAKEKLVTSMVFRGAAKAAIDSCIPPAKKSRKSSKAAATTKSKNKPAASKSKTPAKNKGNATIKKSVGKRPREIDVEDDEDESAQTDNSSDEEDYEEADVLTDSQHVRIA